MFRAYRNVILGTPQTQPMRSDQVANNAGGFAWPVSDWDRLDRFLVLGSEGGTYYVGERELTQQNAQAVVNCIREDGVLTVGKIVQVSIAGRAPKQSPTLFALALCASLGDEATRKAALSALPQVCRTGSHLLEFVGYVDKHRGWGRALRKAIIEWYDRKSDQELAFQALKYQQRGGWSHRDLLRLTHPKPNDEIRQTLLHWIVKGWPDVGDEPHPEYALRQIWATEKLKRTTAPKELSDAAQLIRVYRIPHEAVPTEIKSKPLIQLALLKDMPITAMIRNLGNLSKAGLFDDSEVIQLVVERLLDVDRLKNGRVHPLGLLAALTTYSSGKSVRGSGEWPVNQQIVTALRKAFELSFGYLEPIGGRIALAMDISQSMDGTKVNGIPNLPAYQACGALAYILSRKETDPTFIVFDEMAHVLNWKGLDSVDSATRMLERFNHGGTDCAAPIDLLRDTRKAVDLIVLLTDSETWYGRRHPAEALQDYRRRVPEAANAKLAVVAMASNHVSVADPNDTGVINCVGFDTNLPHILKDFAQRGRLRAS